VLTNTVTAMPVLLVSHSRHTQVRYFSLINSLIPVGKRPELSSYVTVPG